MDTIVMIVMGVMLFAGIAQIVAGVIALVLGQDGADRQRGAKRLLVGGALILLLLALAGVPACTSLPAARVGVAAPVWMLTPVPTVDIGVDALNVWDCQTQPADVCTEAAR